MTNVFEQYYEQSQLAINQKFDKLASLTVATDKQTTEMNALKQLQNIQIERQPYLLNGYTERYNSIKDRMDNLNEQVMVLEQQYKKAKTDKLKKSLLAKKQKLNRTKNEFTKLKTHHKSVVQLRDHRRHTRRNLAGNKNHGKLAWLMPNNPFTNSSYVYLFVTEESIDYSTSVTTVPVEHGVVKSTTTQKQATTVSVTGMIASEMASGTDTLDFKNVKKAVDRIAYWASYGSDMQYSGTNHYKRCIISDFNPDYNLGSDGYVNACSFTMTLTLSDYFHSNEQRKSKKAKKSGTKNAKRGKNKSGNKYIIARSGYTYAFIARKVGVPISDLRDKNKYADKSIPVGSKVYY